MKEHSRGGQKKPQGQDKLGQCGQRGGQEAWVLRGDQVRQSLGARWPLFALNSWAGEAVGSHWKVFWVLGLFVFFLRVLLSYNSAHPFKVCKSVASSIFTELCDHHQHQFQNILIVTKRPQSPLSQSHQSPRSPTPSGNHWSPFCLS